MISNVTQNLFGLLVFLATIVITKTEGRTLDVLNDKLSSSEYDTQERPNAGGPPVNVSVELYITSIHSISEISMDYGATMYLMMRWFDPRISFESPDPIDLRSGSKLQKLIWTPDLYFVNVKQAELHQVTETNKQIRIFPDGHVTSDIRVTLVLICHMHLHRFPMDKQLCHIEMESFSYSIKDVHLKWLTVNGSDSHAVSLPSHDSLPGFILERPNMTVETPLYPM
ncbi:gamma-aminobutyric acid receptor subunit beta-like, partial [Saccoglossus kowalevskii]|uniref:Gamma-aminobutyric acid receptor subunit beta-like n=1 Tax=Saccoglossus kowalevskii TaxID=10224 RepID=A0ABM0MBU7_SACKO